ncbi:MAG: hypothetical protein KUA43_20230 [Hoeflea sp.]|uniref:hypothetical protein n=1 Tax=Hoeflea sp. TaxID=1940281 RepID=UPI001D8C863E|nr:hypothetical protein [Hoeflea sp.]MBU4528145.1 hypothetical protein [Alphaproteobacteria bacterium]MBU4543741.1 hypothetical protein [Alphaproteobacteria bacterium]MBU4548608.1 hypothetical protein [Alphaproteobacteria bacterium]MBV1725774.1 hypothetical protein [Hoeflea sp.]MBV1762130.1 hypothetical protein [Hoeflea sp.]
MKPQTGEAAIRAYKQKLGAIVDKRPSGMRQRLADALGKNRSFVTQITSPSYLTPLPARHISVIFSVCHFSRAEQKDFLALYHAAHPGRVARSPAGKRTRHLTMTAPDLGSEERNRLFDHAVADFINRMGVVFGSDPDEGA